MNEQIQGFADFRVSAWVSNGFVNAIKESVEAIAPYMANVGSALAIVVALAVPNISIAAGAHASAQTSTIVHTVVLDQSQMDLSEIEVRGQLVQSEIDRIQEDIKLCVAQKDMSTYPELPSSTQELAEAALLRIQSSGMMFTKEWAERVANGKA